MFEDTTADIFNLNKTVVEKKPFIDRVIDWLHPKTKANTLFDKYQTSNQETSINEQLFWDMISSVTSRDAKMHHLYSKSMNSPNNKYKLQLVKHMEHMIRVDEIFAEFMNTTTDKLHFCRNANEEGCQDVYVPTDFECLRSLVTTYEQHCGKWHDYARKFIRYLVRECEDPTIS
jgi:hypothetical protein